MIMEPTSNQRFFLALLPPQPIQDAANEIKQYFADRYASCAAFKSPPHITLQPPFLWDCHQLSQLADALQTFAATQSPITITLDGFAAFPPRVIFLHVIPSPELLTLQAQLITFVENTLGIRDYADRDRPFHPHLTVASRDLTPQNFKLAWDEFQGRSLSFNWTATDLTLLMHTGQQWIVQQQFPFQLNPYILDTNQ